MDNKLTLMPAIAAAAAATSALVLLLAGSATFTGPVILVASLVVFVVSVLQFKGHRGESAEELANRQQRLSHSEQVETALANVNAHIMIADADYNIVYINKVLTRNNITLYPNLFMDMFKIFEHFLPLLSLKKAPEFTAFVS